MKKLINQVENVVPEMLEGLVYARKDLKKVPDFNVIARAKKTNKVTLISGGGAGHEPAHAGFVGYGLLDAAVSGEVFTSPTPDQILKAIETVSTKEGTLLVIKNYTGDVMNFEMAAEMAEANGTKVEEVIVADDIAVENSLYTVGRRGVAGTVFVHKIAGSAAEDGKNLSTVKKIAQEVIDNVKTIGMSLGGATIPASGKKSFELAEDEIEMGLGIHGEPGTAKEKLKKASEHVSDMLERLLKEVNLNGEEVAVLVNGLGGTTLMELNIINRDVNMQLEAKGVKIHKSYVGNYMTSLEMPGFSISILKLSKTTKKYLDFKVENSMF
ncbi:dihydroxyacetone kinase subunit DhaK [Mycoplasmopsis caviae]|uniref:Dihydroxyacetone kinase subunit DhaK n=1 Tax=Mycoplasmopsis caviae TaxID=55603 RepID=A0A3P8LAQ1_9BACT|nr:dihydroxyacetone kinase subunit DhaK [Mycoplasmopsis caviae]UUD35288.1 dihydroxyacetone kinase subunit DhaK [Mycoplasmopsis caviae]VDR41931.1 dihydroxyacetone kinase subunit DhaK [Mycoplasmopsis caviae]